MSRFPPRKAGRQLSSTKRVDPAPTSRRAGSTVPAATHARRDCQHQAEQDGRADAVQAAVVRDPREYGGDRTLRASSSSAVAGDGLPPRAGAAGPSTRASTGVMAVYQTELSATPRLPPARPRPLHRSESTCELTSSRAVVVSGRSRSVQAFGPRRCRWRARPPAPGRRSARRACWWRGARSRRRR